MERIPQRGMLFIAVFAAASMVAVAQRAVPTGTFRESGSEGSVEVGIVTVGTAAAGLSSVSRAVCELLTAMAFEPIDWMLVKEFYETPLSIDNQDISLRELARDGIGLFTGNRSPPQVWAAYQTHFGDEYWLDADVLYAIEGGVENDGARREFAQKTIRDGFGTVITLSFLEEARRLIREAYLAGTVDYEPGVTPGLSDSIDSIVKYWDAAWVIFHGYDRGDGDTGRDCAPYGTGESVRTFPSIS